MESQMKIDAHVITGAEKNQTIKIKNF